MEVCVHVCVSVCVCVCVRAYVSKYNIYTSIIMAQSTCPWVV